jgi:hypothetical protein
MDPFVLVVLDGNLSGNGADQCLVVDTEASPMKVVAVAESVSAAAPIRDALNDV